jgi:K+-sensing histidine kinase KdpD
MKNSNDAKYFIVIGLIVALGIITHYCQLNQIGTVYTHLFYIPIIITSCWFQKKGYLIYAIIAAILLLNHFFFNSSYSYLEDLLRLIVMLFTTFLVVNLSADEQRCNYKYSAQEKDLQKSYEKLQIDDKKLKESNAKLKDKLKELEILYNVMTNINKKPTDKS